MSLVTLPGYAISPFSIMGNVGVEQIMRCTRNTAKPRTINAGLAWVALLPTSSMSYLDEI